MTINDIATMAGVSKATISRYLNGGYVSSEKRLLISKIIEKTHFEPNSWARTLRTKKTGIIGVIVPKISSESISRMVEGISEEIAKTGQKILLTNTSVNENEELVYLKTLVNYNVDGIILIGTVITAEHKKLIKECKIPVVILAQQVKSCACVYFDDYEAMKDLSQLLLKKAENVAYIGANKKYKAIGKNRYEGFVAASLENNQNLNIISKISDLSMDSAKKLCKEIFDKNNIDTFICANDNFAIGVMEYIKALGLRIPEDVQIAGVGDTKIGQLINPSLTTIHVPYKTAGMEAAKMLVSMMKGRSMTTMEIKINCEVMLRQSTR